MKKAVLLGALFCSVFLTGQEEILYDNSLRPNQRMVQSSTVEINVSSSTVFADSVPQELVEAITELEKNGSFLSAGGNIERSSTKIRFINGKADPQTSSIPGQMEFLDYKVTPDTLDKFTLKGLKVFYHHDPGKETIIDSVDLSSMKTKEDGEWLREYYMQIAQNLFPSVSSVKQKLKVGDTFTQDIVIPNMFYPGPLTNHQTFTLKEIRDGKGIFDVEIVMELPEEVIRKVDPLDPEFEDMLYFAIVEYNGKGTGTMVYNPSTGIIDRLDLESVTEMEILRFGGSTRTKIVTKTTTSETTSLEN